MSLIIVCTHGIIEGYLAATKHNYPENPLNNVDNSNTKRHSVQFTN